ncbi:hypothetical protein BDQ17DRAFT_1420237 [Cyathus striatus]|nr:hypothetical protein BDQ17DRAFT_1420237 [Cyathus striatus]
MISSQDIFNYATGALAFLSAIASTLLYYRQYLPGVQIKILDELLEETKGMYCKFEAEGLLSEGQLSVSMKDNIESLELDSISLRQQAYNATTTTQEYLAMFRGLSREIMHRAHQVKKFRAYLLSASEEQKRQQQLSRSYARLHDISSRCSEHMIQDASSSEGVADAVHPIVTERPVLDGGQEATQSTATASTAQQFSVDPSLYEQDIPSCCATLVERSSAKWWSLPIPFSRFRWCFEYPTNKPSDASSTELNVPDIISLPV